ncbi:hypothetical protein DPMN_162635 [Dreissena polymorpha]|uniref:Uncharacterized protein n=1 Tax=Dreissena polymorpha TaxID=45954 RepID=A0A9D4IQQ8_DREPO|nr:hypothetical protein DPMN_162635 [Dreissena polymorpha]
MPTEIRRTLNVGIAIHKRSLRAPSTTYKEQKKSEETSSRFILDAAIVQDRHGSTLQFEHSKFAVFFFRSPKDIPGHPMTLKVDKELHGGYTVHIPDRAEYDPC